MKYMDINKMLSDKVLEYMMKGYVINSKSMSGHQGEEGKVDLVKGDRLVRIWISHEYNRDWSNPKAWHGNKMVLLSGLWIYPASKCIDSWTTVWMKDMEILSEEIFYEINNDWYITDEQEAIDTQNKRIDRYKAQVDYGFEDRYDDTRKEIGAKYMKRVHGYKRVSHDKIRVEKHYSIDRNYACYKIIYNGSSYSLK